MFLTFAVELFHKKSYKIVRTILIIFSLPKINDTGYNNFETARFLTTIFLPINDRRLNLPISKSLKPLERLTLVPN